MRQRREFASLVTVVAVLALLAAVVASPLATASDSTRNIGLLEWLAVGPRLVDDGFLGGTPNNCRGDGPKGCPKSTPDSDCFANYQGCYTTPPFTNYCVTVFIEECVVDGCETRQRSFCTGQGD